MKAIMAKLLHKDKDIKEEDKRIVTFSIKTEKETTGLNNKNGLSDSEEQEQILNTLINMADHMKISKINRELQGQYLTLCHLNHMLCQDIIDVNQIKSFLRNKSGQTVQFNKEATVSKQSRPRSTSQSKAIQHYQNYSNGLIFQYYSIRALLWKISTGLLHPSKNKWISLMEGNLIEYDQLVKEHIIDLVVKKKKRKQPMQGEKVYQIVQQKKMASDHPLNLLKESKWKNFFDDKDLWNTIEKDTIRTKPKCKFFQEEYQIEFLQFQVLSKYSLSRSQIHLSKLKDKTKTYYYDCLTRIIYIYLKKHPKAHYSQGMNELAALVFYSYANKNSQYFRRVAESDSFFTFQKIMKYLLKFTPNGILNGEKYSHKFEDLLKRIDLRLYQILQKGSGNLNNLKIVSMKWFNSFFLTEFEIDETLILWDGFISIIPAGQNESGGQINLPNFLISLGLAIVHLNRLSLSQGENPLLVFRKIGNSPESILEKAFNLYKIYKQFFQ